MVHHIILWKIKDGISDADKAVIKKNVKEGLEGLMGKVTEIQKIHVQIDSLSTSTADIMLDSEFKTAEDLKAYSVNPHHVKVATESVAPYMEVRMCLDFED